MDTKNNDEFIDDRADMYDYQLLIEELPLRVGLHSKNHTERVLMLAYLLAEENHLSIYEKKILYQSVVFHDAGRIDDSVDLNHGWGGYIEYIKKFGPNDVAEFLIVFHCKPDSDAKKYLKTKKLSMDNERVWLLYQILKDSDALDRIRFGGLNTNYLRLRKSHELIEIAKYMIEADLEKENELRKSKLII